MDQTGFYILFIPGLTIATIAVGFAFSGLAMTQGAFQPGTRWGLVSLAVILLLVAALFVVAQGFHPVLPKPGR